MILADHTISIERPIHDVFDYVANHENYADWFPGVIGIVSGNELPHGSIGKTYLERIKMPTGRARLIEISVVESESPVLFATEGYFPPLHPRMEVHFKRLSENCTEVRWMFSSRSESTLGRLLVRMLIRRDLLQRSTQGMASLKRALESC